MPVGEASVIIAVSSKHRKESLDAVEFAINTVKATVTIWKKVGNSMLVIPYIIILLYGHRRFMKMETQNGNRTRSVSGQQIMCNCKDNS